MAKPFLLSFSLCLLLLFTSACLAERLDRFNECQLDRLNALEPDNRIESEGGVIETWNSNHPELRCAGVAFEKLTIEPLGLHLPSYTNYPQFIMIVQGQGALGISVAGCSETFEEPQSQSRQSQGKQQQDSHQKIRHFREGDILVIPPGTPYWTYNYGNEQLVAINLLDTTSLSNQLDPNPRRFYLAGNPEEEHPETQQQGQQRQQHQRAGGRKQGQHQQEEEEEEGKSNVLSGFDPQFLSQALNIDKETVHRLQNPNDRLKQIIRVKGGLSVISPEWQEVEEEEEQEPRHRGRHGRREERGGEEEEEEEEEEQRGRGREGREWKRTTRRKHTRGEEGEEEVEEETTTQERPHRGGRGRGQQQEEEEEEEEQGRRGKHGHKGRRQREQEEEEEQSPQEPRRRHGGLLQGSGNGLEETICTASLRENIADPSRADLYNPTAGRISTVNSLTLPILRWFQLSAEYVNLYKNGIYAPHWNVNANSVIYVIRGRGRVQVVNCQGNSVFNDELRRGQLLVVPQNFVVAHQAEDKGFEFIAFKTNDQATTSPMKQVFRGIPAEVLANAFGLRLNQVSELKYNGNQGPLVSPQSQSEDHTLVKVA